MISNHEDILTTERELRERGREYSPQTCSKAKWTGVSALITAAHQGWSQSNQLFIDPVKTPCLNNNTVHRALQPFTDPVKAQCLKQ